MAARKHPDSVVRIGTAGWHVPKAYADASGPLGSGPVGSGKSGSGSVGSHLERYSRTADCVEINSTFHRPHREATFARWAATTPAEFRFAIKAPKAVTHIAKLCRCGGELAAFFAQLAPLGEKLGPVLVQLPPKLAFDEGVAHEFFTTLRELHSGQVVVEPRHATWFIPEADRLMRSFEVARAMADPPAGSALATEPGGWPGLQYFRLHGSPRTYWSAYSEDFLSSLAKRLQAATESATQATRRTPEIWVVFDNTAGNQAFGNAMTLRKLLALDQDERKQIARSPPSARGQVPPGE